jgi:hypothetical protein
MNDPNWGQGAQGAVGGAMTGAAIGSVVPVIGTGIGAVAGGIIGGGIGLFGGGGAADYEDRLKKLAEGYRQRQAPQMGAAAQSGYSDFRRNQAGLVSQLESMARGEGPSAAALQMREAMDRAAGSQASGVAGAGGRGVNAGAAFRNASNNTAAIQAQGARDTATLRAQEQMNAVGMLGQAVAQGRAADENNNQFNAGQTNQVAQANLDAKLRALGINTQAELQALQSAMGAAGPGMGTQLMGMGASALGPALQYSMGQQQMKANQAQQQQLQAQQQAQQQAALQRQQYVQSLGPSTQNTGWGYSQPQSPGMNYWGAQFIPQVLTNPGGQ